MHHWVSHLQRSLENLCRPKYDQHHRPKVLPLCQLLQNPDQVYAAEEIPPTVSSVGRRALGNVRDSLGILWIENAMWEVQSSEVVSRSHVLTDVLVEKLEHERDAVGKDEMLTHVLKLVDVVDFEVFEEE